MTICDVCKTRPAALRVSAELRVGPKTQRKGTDLCKPCHDANAAALEAAVVSYVAVIDGLKPAVS